MIDRESKLNIKLQKHGLILIGVSIIVLLLFIDYLYYRYEVNDIWKEKYDELEAIAQLKTNQIIEWRKERLADAQVFTKSPFILQNVKQWIFSKNISLRTNVLKGDVKAFW